VLASTILGSAGRLIRAVVDFALPALCALCGRRLAEDEVAVCMECLTRLAPACAPFCRLCARPGPRPCGWRGGLCSICADHGRQFERHRAYGLFEGDLARAIRLLKYSHRRSLAQPLGVLQARVVRADYILRQAEIVVPVPLHRTRRRDRGYNQSELLAQAVADLTGRSCTPRILRRRRATRTQTKLTQDERLANVRGAFWVGDPGEVSGRSVLLVDDVFTTGATLDACAAALLEAGARSVAAVTVAVAPAPPTGRGRT